MATAPPKARYIIDGEGDIYARRANRIRIQHRHGEVVAVIEIVSPGNKSSQTALRAFVRKAADLIWQGIHLLVVDLFPPSGRDPQGIHKAIWDEVEQAPFELPPDKSLTVAAYRAGPTKTAYLEPLAVGESEASSSGKSGVLVVVGIIAGAGIGAAVALAAMAALGVSPF